MSDAELALNLSADEKRAFSYLFAQADNDQLGVVTGENAVSFFERTKVSPAVLGEIWQVADTENRGLLTKPGFCIVLRLIGHYQAGREPTSELAFKPAPIPKFDGLQIPGLSAVATVQAAGSAAPSPTGAAFPPNTLQPQLSGQGARVPQLDPQKVAQYSALFERYPLQNGLLDGASAKAIFEKAGLPNEVLGRIWNLADREQKGALDRTEFIIAMHLLTSMKSRTMTTLPPTLPPGLYEAAARRGGPPPGRQGPVPAAIPRQVTGGSAGAAPRTQSPLARPPGYATPPPQSAQGTGTPWLITPAEKTKYDQHFNDLDIQGRGLITGEQAVSFFSDSRLPEETLAQIWDLADINSEGQLNKDEFAVAMYLIRQQRMPNAAPLPAFLPPPLIPPSMRKQPQQTAQSTAPAFDNANNTSNLPKSAADDLFGLDQPSSPQTQPSTAALQPQGTGASATRDPFGGSTAAGPSSPARFQAPPQTASNVFKPFVPTSAFGASLTKQNTGGSAGSNQPAPRAPSGQRQPPSAMDDLLGDNEASTAEASKITHETTELANMSNQIGNLRSQMEQTQAKKTTTQADLTATSNQKRDLELRLQQFRSQYEQEVKTVKELEQQLVASKESTKKLGQELAMLEGTYQDLQSQHQTVSQALQADQQENAGLKQRIAEVNAEVARLKPETEKLKLDARQQKGLVSINKKQLATNESERDRLQDEKASLEREAAEREEQIRAAAAVEIPAPASNLASPASTLSATNPFFRKASNDGAMDRSMSSSNLGGVAAGPTPSAFDTLFGPSSAFAPNGQAGSRTGTPPATSFVGRSVPATSSSAAVVGMTDSVQSISSKGEPTPSATPPLSDQAKESPLTAEPPPPPESRQFKPSHLPVVDVEGRAHDSETSSTRALPPASRAGEVDTPKDAFSDADRSVTPHVSFTEDPKPETAAQEQIPGAFPTEPWPSSTNSAESTTTKPEVALAPAKDDFDSAFANFGDHDKAAESSKENHDPFASSSSQPAPTATASEFPPIETFEPADESDSEDEGDRGFDDNFTTASPPRNQVVHTTEHGAPPPPSTAPVLAHATGAATAVSGVPSADADNTPPKYDDSNKISHGGTGERTEENQFPSEFGGLLPAREDPTSPPPPELPTGSSPATASTKEVVTDSKVESSKSAAAKNAFDDFDDFDNLAEAKEADKSTDFDFGFVEGSTEFDSTFGSPAASMTNTMASSQQTPVPAARSLHQSESSNGFSNFQPSASTSSAFETHNSSLQQTPQNVQHDWDAIFSGLDGSKGIDTSLSTNDPWAAPANGGGSSSAAAASSSSVGPPPPIPASKPNPTELGRAITPGTEHDDPILKRLTGMGYPRKDALDALEKYDYDINKAVDHLTGT